MQEKLFAAFLGQRHCGKSALTDAFLAAFPNYVTTFSGKELMIKPSGGEVSRDLTFALHFEHSRLAISNELPSIGKLDGTTLKMLASGTHCA
jgi:hypothetical protein